MMSVHWSFLPARRYTSTGICYDISVFLCVTCVLCIKMAKPFIKILLPPDSPIILVFHHWGLLLNSNGFTPNGMPNIRGEKIGRFLTNKSVYLRNSARYGHSCYGSQVGNHTQAIKWWHLWLPWMTQPQFQGHPTVWRQISCKQCMLQLAS